MDKKIFFAFYRYANEHEKFKKTITGVAYISSALFMVVYTIVGLYLLYYKRTEFYLFLTVPCLTLCISTSARALIKRTRPYVAFGLAGPLKDKKSYSFPSNHATSSAIISFACLYIYLPLGLFMFAIAVFTALSRVFAALHYPSDIVCGFVLSALCAAIGFNIIPYVIFK